MTSSPSKLIPLALGAFAIGTESYVVAGVLPTIASDLGVTLPLAGQLITAFALTYALGSPLIAVATGGMERRRLLLASIAAFGLFNLLAAFSHTYALLFTARIGMGLAAGPVIPAASAYPGSPPTTQHRRRPLSIIYRRLPPPIVAGPPLPSFLPRHFPLAALFFPP